MDYAEILDALNQKKSEKEKKPSDKPKRQGGKGHPNYFKGKKIDRRKFETAIDAFFGGMAIRRAWKLSGLSEPTFKKRLTELVENGNLPDYLFTDGMPMYITLKPPSEYAMIAHELKELEKYKGER